MPVFENNYDDQLKQLIQSNTQFISLMGHEIRTYMNGIIGFATVLENDTLTEQQKEFVHSILENGNGLIGMTDKIVEYSRIRAMDQAGVIRRPVATDELIKTIDDNWSGAMKVSNHNFKIVMASGLPEKFNGCQDHIVRCIDILLDNALTYTDSGDITLALSYKYEEDDGAFLLIDVVDNGAGIEYELQQTVFEPFERGEHEMMTSGLGLTILAALVGLNNGAVYFDSTPGEGSDFSICLPIETLSKGTAGKTSSQHKQNESVTEIKSDSPAMFSAKVLVADDNYSSRKLMKVILENLGCDCDFAKNGKAVLEMIDDKYDLILMDIRMPDMSGLEVTAKLRDSGFEKPIIAVTAFAMPSNEQECIAAGCNGYVSKPLSRETLVHVLDNNLSRKKI